MESYNLNSYLAGEWPQGVEFCQPSPQFTIPSNHGLETSANYVTQSNEDFGLYTNSYSSYYQSINYSYSINENYTQQPFSYDQSSVGSYNQAEQPSPISSNGTLNDFFEIDDIINSKEVVDDELQEVLSTAGLSDLLNDNTSFYSESSTNSPSSSASSTPKRKYSTDSSDCLSFSSFDISPLSKPKRFRRSKHTKEERAARKKDQNKKAASKYRNRKKDEKHNHDQTLEELESVRDNLSAQIEKLRTEFNVILPLAKAAFSFDSSRNELLKELINRLNSNNLL